MINQLNKSIINNQEKILRFPEETSLKTLKINNAKGIYLRNCYFKIKNLIFESISDDILVIGNPGIGKTFFTFYLMHICIKNKKSFLFEPNQPNEQNIAIYFYNAKKNNHSNSKIVLFSSYRADAFDSEIDEIAYFFVDGHCPRNSKAKIILTCSPREEYYKDLDKSILPWIYMPIWSKEELESCRSYMFSELSNELMTRLLNHWGPIPRYVLNQALDFLKRKKRKSRETLKGTQEDLTEDEIKLIEQEVVNSLDIKLKEAIDKCSIESILFFTGRLQSNDRLSNRVFHIKVNEHNFTKESIDFASPYVTRLVYERLIKSETSGIRTQLAKYLKNKQFEKVEYSRMGHIFENYAHDIISNGGHFQIRALEDRKEKLSTKINLDPLFIEKLETIYFDNSEQVELFHETSKKTSGCYYLRPNNSSIETIDSISISNKTINWYNMTISMKHDFNFTILINHLMDILVKSKDEMINFYYVVFERDAFEGFKKPKCACSNDSKDENERKNIVQDLEKIFIEKKKKIRFYVLLIDEAMLRLNKD